MRGDLLPREQQYEPVGNELNLFDRLFLFPGEIF
jgi:hypothetical protein